MSVNAISTLQEIISHIKAAEDGLSLCERAFEGYEHETIECADDELYGARVRLTDLLRRIEDDRYSRAIYQRQAQL